MDNVESIAVEGKKTESKMGKIIKLIKDVFACKFRLPKFKFDENLFYQLVEESAAKLGVNEIGEARVNFKEGPIDMIAGTFNFNTKEIIVDYLEIFLISLLSFPKNQVELMGIYKDKVISTLGHETGHWILDMKKGNAPVKEIKKMTLKYLLIFLIPFFFIAWGLVKLFWGFTVSFYAVNLLLGLTLGSAVAVIGFVLIVLVAVVNFLFSAILAKAVTYHLCEHEKFAREYALEIAKDERWKDVIVFRTE